MSGIAIHNDGIIKNCVADYKLQLNASGDGECMISGIASINKGLVVNCSLTKESEIVATECDIGGIVCVNEKDGKVLDSINRGILKQTSGVKGWSPNLGGIALTNYGEIGNSHNLNSLEIESTIESEDAEGSVFLGGISAINYGNIISCVNNGNINVKSSRLIVYAGGISAYSTYITLDTQSSLPKLQECGVNSVINIVNLAEDGQMCVGGISGYLYGELSKCYSLSTFETGYTENKHFVGLAIGATYYQNQLFGGYLCLSAESNDVLLQDNVPYQIGVVLQYNNNILSNGVNVDDVEDIRTVSSADSIIEKEVDVYEK